MNISLGLYVRFYQSCGGIQNMWIEKEGCDGMRYEVNSFEDVKNAFEQYITQVADKNIHKFDMKC